MNCFGFGKGQGSLDNFTTTLLVIIGHRHRSFDIETKLSTLSPYSVYTCLSRGLFSFQDPQKRGIWGLFMYGRHPWSQP